MTGWDGAGAGYIGLIDPTVSSEFHLKFVNAANDVLADNVLNLVVNSQHVLGARDDNPFNYFDYTLNGAAPAGTATVRVSVNIGKRLQQPGRRRPGLYCRYLLAPSPRADEHRYAAARRNRFAGATPEIPYPFRRRDPRD
jgi:hypothetical protein